LRILQFNNYADPIGGAEVYALALTRELAQRGHEVGFFGTSPEREADEDHLRVVRRPRYEVARLYRDADVGGALETYLRRLRPEIVHVHNVFAMGLDVLRILGTCGIPLVQTVHDFSLLCPNSWCVRGDGTICAGGAGAQCFQHECQRNNPYDPEVLLHTLLKHRTLAGIVDVAIAPSAYLAQRLRESGFRDVRHRNYFIDPIATPEGGERRTKELVFIGRLEPEKGVEHLLDAWPRILQGAPGARLTVVGGGTLSDALRARAQALGLAESVTFLSHVPRAELGRFYATATACVVPSIWSENSPLVAYECLTAGLPMIASRIGGIPELVEEGRAGFTFTPRSPEDLAEKALRLLGLSAETRAEMSASMRRRARDFQPPAHLEWITEVFQTLVARGPGPRVARLEIDGDFAAILEQYGHEKARLGSLFNEHVRHIRHLEQIVVGMRSLAATDAASQSPPPERSLEQHKPRLPFLQRLARAFPRTRH
jgi:glycosyltransferase involved in cell wall biosynthesis